MSSSIFIVATDTDAGKTWVTRGLLRNYQALGESVQALKPLACGLDVGPTNESAAMNGDVAVLQQLQPQLLLSDINFKTYMQPLAPALAAQQEGVFSSADLLAWLAMKQESVQTTLIESVGGLMTPLLAAEDDTWSVADWLLDMPTSEVLLVVPLRLGCMNQALMACATLKAMNRKPRWILFNDIEGLGTAEETISTLTPFLKRMFGMLPAVLSLTQGQKNISLE